METVIKEVRKFIGQPWPMLGSLAALLVFASWGGDWGDRPTTLVGKICEFLGVSEDWPSAVGTWLHSPVRLDALQHGVLLLGAVLLLAHVFHAWSRGGDLEFVREVRRDESVERANVARRELTSYNVGRMRQTYASAWIVLAIAIELDALTRPVAVVGLAVWLGSSALKSRRVDRGDRLFCAIGDAFEEVVHAAMAAFWLPALLLALLFMPRREPEGVREDRAAAA